jgi:hypothetical protein
MVASSISTFGEMSTVNVGDTSIALPAPEGFFRYDGRSKKVDQMQQGSLTAGNRLLASFGSEDDLAQTLADTYPKLERNFNAQSVKKLEEVSIFPDRFNDLKSAIRTQMDSVRQKLGDKIAEIENNMSLNLSKEFQTGTDFKLGDMILLGVFDETPNSISFSMLTKYRLTAAKLEESIEGVSTVAATALNLHNRVIYLYCTSICKDKRDIDWARNNVKKWRDNILAANHSATTNAPPRVGPAPGQDARFRCVQLVYDISLEIPSHWNVLSQETRLNLGTAGEAIIKNAGVKAPSGKKQSLLAVNAVPDPTGATIRVSVTTPPGYTQADLTAATKSDLDQLASQMRVVFKKLEATGGPKILEVEPARIEHINNQLAIVTSYTRAGLVGPSPWQVTQYKVPVGDRLIEITLSHRQSDAAVWKPILEHVKRSIRF